MLSVTPTRTRATRRRRLGATAALGLMLAALAATADAQQVFREDVHDERNVVLEDYCGVPGLTVELAWTLDMRVKIVPHGRDRLAYYLQHGTVKEVLTNPATGTSLTSVAKSIEKDLRVTDNGDGTIAVLDLATGNAVLYGPDGKAIARNPGQTRFELLIDDGGTPTDPSDDEVVGQEVVKESTGRSDDLCEAAVRALG